MEVDNADKGEGDGTDARGMFGKFIPKLAETVQLSGAADSNEFCMNYTKRGKCYIFNHKVFASHTNLNVRNGTDVDAARLYGRFRDLGFDTKVFANLTVREVTDKLKEAGKDDHSDSSCFVCCILSHGEYGILYASDGKYRTEDVFAPFRGDVCPTLVGKPKLFFIQACQGDKLDSGVNVTCKESIDSASQFKIPTHADFLIVYSTVPGFYSWRNTTHGSWFIQALCTVLQEHAKDTDILNLLTIVNRKVAFDFESCVPTDPIMHLKKQVPLITSTLTRLLKFS